ncbi:MAG: pyridoxal phosphate-dependent aminotransferase [Candidatus Zixiibacteriota bacterium]|nr:MAG: pyridoxal phosphate-dependent aminotransferase [candidate division Zixibacteria bacterium]
MRFQPSLYMEYAKDLGHFGAEYNLAASGIACPFTMAEMGVDARVLEWDPAPTYGHPALREEIARRYGVQPEQVLAPGGGSSLVNFLLGAALLDRGDRVLMETPTYESLEATLASTGAELIPFPRPPEKRWALNPEEAGCHRNSRLKLIAVTRLHNPSGMDIPEETLLRLAHCAEELDAWVLVDEVYLDYLPPERIRVAALLHPRLITTSSLTKVYGQGDLRAGWALAPADLVARCWRINNVLGVNPAVVPERIALELFRNGSLDRLAAWARQRGEDHWPLVEAALSNHPDLEWVKPEGGIFVFVRHRRWQDASAFVEFLARRYRTLVMPGRFFGRADGFRLGFGGGRPELEEGLKRIGEALEEFGG